MHNKQLIKTNKQKFKPFIIGSVLIAHHQHVKKLGTWGTQVELIATLEKYSPIVVDKRILASHTLNFSTSAIYFDPVVSSSISLCEASESTIPRREYQSGEIKN